MSGIPDVAVRFLDQARATPHLVAVHHNGHELTYAQLAEQVDDLTSRLRAAGVDGGPTVVLLPHGIPLVVAILATFASGSTFVPATDQWPDDYLAAVVRRAGAAVVVTDAPGAVRLAALNGTRAPVAAAVRVVAIDDSHRPESPAGEPRAPSGQERAYLYFTSGSTGTPKAVVGSLRGLGHFIGWEIDEFGVGPGRRTSLLTIPTFDPFLRDIFVPLCSGATLCIPPSAETILDGPALLAWLEDDRIDLVHLVPTLLRELVRGGRPAAAYRPRLLLLAGEPVRGSDITQARDALGDTAELVNLYGPTETTLATCWRRLTLDDATSHIVPVGRPLPGSQVQVCDADGRPQPPGVEGELVIVTHHASHGYLDDPVLTDRSFEGFGGPGPVRYRTGDRGYLTPDGDVVCLGRLDSQVKVRGMKVDLANVERRLRGLPAIRDAVVHQSDDGTLVAAVSAPGGVTAEEIDTALVKVLPRHMVPGRYLVLPGFPTLPNGKVDRQRLRAADQVPDAVSDAVSDAVTRGVVHLWREVLGAAGVHAGSNFFLLGGHSMLAARLARAIRERFAVTLGAADILEHPTVAAQVALIRAASPAPGIPAADVPIGSEVSPQERAIFLADALATVPTTYLMPWAYRVTGPLDVARIRSVTALLVQRHDALRTTYAFADAGITARVRPPDAPVDVVRVLDVSDNPPHDEATLLRLLDELTVPFDLSSEIPLRVVVVRLAPDDHVLLFHLHHIAGDEASQVILEQEFALGYVGGDLPPAVGSYRGYAARAAYPRDAADASGRVHQHLTNLREVPRLNLPRDPSASGRQSNTGRRTRWTLPLELVEDLLRRGAEWGVTPFEITLTGFALALGGFAETSDLVLGVAAQGREDAHLENTVGVFMSAVPVRCTVDPDGSLHEATMQVAGVARAARRLGAIPADVLESPQFRRNPGLHPVFDVMVVHQDPDRPELALPGCAIEPLRMAGTTSRYDLTLYLHPRSSGWDAEFEYCTDLFSEGYVRALWHALCTVLAEICHRPDLALREVELVSVGAEPLPGGIDAALSPLPPALVHERFAAHAQMTPDAPALCFGDEEFSYAQVRDRAAAIAVALRRHPAFRPGAPVGVMMSRTPDLVATLLAVLASGAPYVPLDVGFPPARIAHILDRSRVGLIATDGTVVAVTPDVPSLDVTTVRATHSVEEPVAHGPVDVALTDSAYQIFTSGSTGFPKGVDISHGNLVNFVDGIAEAVGLDRDLRVCCLTTVSFDIFVLEVLVPLALGGVVVLADEREQLDLAALAKLLRRHRVNTLQLTPSRLSAFLDAADAEAHLQGISTFVIGGEPITQDGVRRLLSFAGPPRVFNAYGPTETCVWSTVKRIESVDDLTIGRAIKNTRLYVMDRRLRLRPRGLPGELCIGGHGVATGYVHDPHRTTRAFVADRYHPGERIYRTGDIVRWNDRDELAFIGREDQQVKVRGYRVELREIEIALNAHPDIREAVCVLTTGHTGAAGEVHAAYTSAEPIPDGVLRSHLAEHLPSYCVPTGFWRLAELPVTPNAKIDRNAVKAWLTTSLGSATRPDGQPNGNGVFGTGAQATDPESAFVRMTWAELLGRSTFDDDANFFDVGGNSLLLVRLHNAIERRYPGRLTLPDLFGYPTVGLTATQLRTSAASAAATATASATATAVATATTPTPLPVVVLRNEFRVRSGNGTRAVDHPSPVDPTLGSAVSQRCAALGIAESEFGLAAFVSALTTLAPPGPVEVVAFDTAGARCVRLDPRALTPTAILTEAAAVLRDPRGQDDLTFTARPRTTRSITAAWCFAAEIPHALRGCDLVLVADPQAPLGRVLRVNQMRVDARMATYVLGSINHMARQLSSDPKERQ